MSLRFGLLALVAIGIAGATFELAFERHWESPTQLIPWAALGVLTLALILLAFGGSPRTVTVVRVLALVVLLTAAYGGFVHVSVNYGAGGSDSEWSTLSPLTQWWYAATKTVGFAPPLAPGMLAQSALMLLLASLTSKRREPAGLGA
ncbi:hypothetical protein ETD86_11750 [Nonomuraea turkmeniaca]|uniref:Uncharacterized protein n=1 Tax=Nonomuraea turkmeniaca TaxID=103838 RepID=A0A5S4FQE4_9ACTN|nr:hypothetical protein ETD86_11750 [Nonomuraea turkmeniaca]